MPPSANCRMWRGLTPATAISGRAQQPRRRPLQPAGRLHHHQRRRLFGHHPTQVPASLRRPGRRAAARRAAGRPRARSRSHRRRQTLELVPRPLASCHVCGLPDGQVGPRSTVQVEDSVRVGAAQTPGLQLVAERPTNLRRRSLSRQTRPNHRNVAPGLSADPYP
jgi:hypothetical protein